MIGKFPNGSAAAMMDMGNGIGGIDTSMMQYMTGNRLMAYHKPRGRGHFSSHGRLRYRKAWLGKARSRRETTHQLRAGGGDGGGPRP